MYIEYCQDNICEFYACYSMLSEVARNVAHIGRLVTALVTALVTEVQNRCVGIGHRLTNVRRLAMLAML